jgi:hypothetical protein
MNKDRRLTPSGPLSPSSASRFVYLCSMPKSAFASGLQIRLACQDAVLSLLTPARDQGYTGRRSPARVRAQLMRPVPVAMALATVFSVIFIYLASLSHAHTRHRLAYAAARSPAR